MDLTTDQYEIERPATRNTKQKSTLIFVRTNEETGKSLNSRRNELKLMG